MLYQSIRNKGLRNLFLLGLVVILTSGCVTERVFRPINKARASQLNAELGLGYMKQGQYKRAKRKLEKALKFNDENIDALHYMGELHRRLGSFDEAGKYFSQAIELDPDNKVLINNYGVYLCNNKQYDQAIEIFNKSLADPLYEEKSSAYENVGLCRLWQGQIGQAELAFRQALKLNPDRASSLLELAKMQFDQGLGNEAYDYYSRYLAIAAHTPESLWLGILLEHARGAKNTVASYKVKLKGRYPESELTKRLRNLEAQGKI